MNTDMNADTLELLCRPSPHFIAYKKAYEHDIKMAREPYAESWWDYIRGIPKETRQTERKFRELAPRTEKTVNRINDFMDNIEGKGFGAAGVGIQKFLGDNWPLLFGALAAGGGGYALDRGSGGSGMGGALGGISLLGLLYLFATQTEAGKKMFGPVFDPAYWADTQTKADADAAGAATQQQTEQKPLEGTPVTKPELLLTTEQQQQVAGTQAEPLPVAEQQQQTVGTQAEVSTAKAEQQQSVVAQQRPATLPTENFPTRKTNNLSLLINKSS
jgi:hypothetical protein